MRPGGLLALNVVARTLSLLGKLVLDLKRTFLEGEVEEEKEEERQGKGLGSSERTKCSVFLIKASEETANTTLIVVKGGVPIVAVSPVAPKSTGGGGKKKTPSPAISPTPSGPASGSGAAKDAASLRTAREEAVEEWLKVRTSAMLCCILKYCAVWCGAVRCSAAQNDQSLFCRQ
jgi:hypothetical protein